MSAHKIKYSKKEAVEKLNTRISKGKLIAEKALELIRENPDKDNDRFYVDKFNTDYKQWYEITNSILIDIYESSNYAYSFRHQKSSKREYVNSSWQPNITYYLTYEMLPKLNYLKVLKDNIDDYSEVNSDQSNIENNKLIYESKSQLSLSESTNEEFEIAKISIWDILKRVSLPQLFSILGGLIVIISGSFYFGYNVKSWQIDKDKIELVRQHETDSQEIKSLEKNVDSLKRLDSSKIKTNKNLLK